MLDNRDHLVTVLAIGRIAPPRVHPELIAHDTEGRTFFLPGAGGVHPFVHVGDPVDDLVADHLLPGASAEDASVPATVPGAFHLLASVGNRVFDGAGEPLGIVVGKRGGLAPGFWPPSLLGIEATTERLAQLSPGDPVRLEAVGRGLRLLDYPGVVLSNVAPRLLDALPLESDGTRLMVAVAAVIPSRAAGAGLGQDAWIGDLEIADHSAVSGLRYGDLVAFEGIDAATARFHSPGHVSVGVVAHGPGAAPGHGIGITILITGAVGDLRIRVAPDSGLGKVLRAWGEHP